jgi:hypothetical protein
MDAATTSLVRSVWQNYFSPEHQLQLQQQADQQQQQQQEAAGAAAGGGELAQPEVSQVRWQYSLDGIAKPANVCTACRLIRSCGCPTKKLSCYVCMGCHQQLPLLMLCVACICSLLQFQRFTLQRLLSSSRANT